MMLIFFVSFIYFLADCVFIAACRLSLVAVIRGYSLLPSAGFSLPLLLLWSMGFSGCGTQALELGLGGCGARA